MFEEKDTGVNEPAAEVDEKLDDNLVEETVEEPNEEPTEELEQTGEEEAAAEPEQDEMGRKIKEIRESMKQDYEKKYGEYKGKAEQLETTLDKAARLSGYPSVEAYLQAVDDAEKQAQEQRYKDAGITDPKIIEELIEKNPVVQQAKQLTEKQRFQDEVNELATEFKEVFERDIAETDVSEEVIRHREQTGKSLSEAFFYLNRKNLKSFMQDAKKKAEKQTIANIHDRARRGVISNDGGVGEDIDTTDIDIEMAMAFGHDPREIAKYKKSKLKRS